MEPTATAARCICYNQSTRTRRNESRESCNTAHSTARRDRVGATALFSISSTNQRWTSAFLSATIQRAKQYFHSERHYWQARDYMYRYSKSISMELEPHTKRDMFSEDPRKPRVDAETPALIGRYGEYGARLEAVFNTATTSEPDPS